MTRPRGSRRQRRQRGSRGPGSGAPSRTSFRCLARGVGACLMTFCGYASATADPLPRRGWGAGGEGGAFRGAARRRRSGGAGDAVRRRRRGRARAAGYERQHRSTGHADPPRGPGGRRAGRGRTGVDTVEWAKRVEDLGAGEILLTSMDTDGTQDGYDLPLTRAVAAAVRIPVIASGGAGRLEHLAQALDAGAHGVLAAT